MKKNLIIIFTTFILLPNISLACHGGGYQGDFHKGAFNKFKLIDNTIKLRCGNNNSYNNSFSNICY
jgi:hypothetical protein